MKPKASVIIPTYKRSDKLKNLLEKLNQQSTHDFEVIVINDGDPETKKYEINQIKTKYQLKYLEQGNTGPGAARQRGAKNATGEILVFIDDDMLPCDYLVEEHIKSQRDADVVLGKISHPDSTKKVSSFERFHLNQLNKYMSLLESNTIKPTGPLLCTGNVSVRKSIFDSCGGFDPNMSRSEDRDLGIRLEQHGARFKYNRFAATKHETDHSDKKTWLARARNYGINDYKIAEKHRGQKEEEYSPWRYLSLTHKYVAILLASSYMHPNLLNKAPFKLLELGETLNNLGMQGIASRAAGLSYGIEYFTGVREASQEDNIQRFAWEQLAIRTDKSSLENLIFCIVADHHFSSNLRSKYGDGKKTSFDITRIGTQIALMIRLMNYFKENNQTLFAKTISRMIRHLYCADIHWSAKISPCVSIVHGNGIVISKSAVIEKNCILFHNVTVGESIDPRTRRIGAPHIEENVHIGPGCSLIGPIRIGKNSKLMAGSTITHDIPANSRISPAINRNTKKRLSIQT